jgi:hypothetical protein
MEWTIKLEARSGWGEVETIEVGRLKRRAVGLTADEVGLTLTEGKDLLSGLQRLILQTQMEDLEVGKVRGVGPQCRRRIGGIPVCLRLCQCQSRARRRPCGTAQARQKRSTLSCVKSDANVRQWQLGLR